MKKPAVLIFCCALALYGADPDWQVPEAEFRLIVKADFPAENSYLNFGDYAMPILLGKGIDVRDRNGNRIPFYLHQTLGTILGPAAESEYRYIYFGLPETAPPDQWPEKLGEAPPDHTLYCSIYGQWHQYRTGQEWLDNQVRSLETRFRRNNAWMFKYLLQNLIFGALSPEHSLLRQPVVDKRAEPVAGTDWNEAFDREDYKCWRYADRVRRLNVFSEREMRNSYRNPYRFSQARIDWAWRRLYLARKNLFQVLPRLTEQAPRAPLNEFTNMFKPPHRNPLYAGNQVFFHLDGDAFSSRRNLAAVMGGRLIVPEDGEYEFKAETAGSFLFYLDDELKVSKYNEPVLEKSLKISLKAGLTKLKLCFHRPAASPLTLSWKKPGADRFAVLTEDDFAPARPCRPVAMQERERGDIPLIREHVRYELFIGKTEKRQWREMSVVARPEAGTAPEVTFLLDGVPVFTGGRGIVVTGPDDHFGVMSESYPPTRLFWLRGDDGFRGRLHAGIELRTHLPDFIYDDEELQMFVEVSSGLSVEGRGVLSVRPDRPNSMFADGDREIVIPPRRTTQEGAYAADGICKYPVSLKGAELKNGLTVDFNLKMPGLTFSERRLRFIPVTQLPPVTLDALGYFQDESGAWVVPVLHRPGLGELRRWELPVKLKNRIIPRSHMLFIGDDPGGLREALEAALDEKKMALTFLAWGQDRAPLNRMRHDFSRLSARIPECRADLAVIVPAADDLYGNIPPRSQVRHLAALLQIMRANPNIQAVYLCTPLPAEGTGQAAAALTEELYKLARDFGVEVINLHYLLRARGETDPAGIGDIPEFCRLLIYETVR